MKRAHEIDVDMRPRGADPLWLVAADYVILYELEQMLARHAAFEAYVNEREGAA